LGKAPSTSDTTNVASTGIEFNKVNTNDHKVLKDYRLEQNYPNPFNPATIIQFSIKKKSFASLKIYDILGNEVAVLIENLLEAGFHSIEFNASDLPSGIYMYRLQTDEISLTKKMILLK